MREIDFRGKRKDNGEWVYGYYGGCFDSGPDGVDYIIFNPGYNKVDPATVGQYIGLPDINGKKIFTTDIVRCRDTFGPTYTGKVCFANGSFCIDSGICTHYRWLDYEVEVIGNVFDNNDTLEAIE